MHQNENAQEADYIKNKMQEARQARATAYHDVFVKSPAGAKILTEWISSYSMGGIPGNNATEREVALRDGKQQLIKTIIDQINIATGKNND